LYSPLAGVVTQINESLIQDPTAINLDKYGAGWLFELRAAEPSSGDPTTATEPLGKSTGLLSPDQYIEHLNAAWEVAQRTIKGQVNAE
jgi:glycine cleavage system H protein